MAVPTVVLLLLLYTLPLQGKAEPPLAKPGCPKSCGNGSFTIPFPFGVGTRCFLDEWYEIDCRNGSTPFLKKIGLEVLGISLPARNFLLGYSEYQFVDGTIQVSYPVVSKGSCTGQRRDLPLSLEGSNFIFSQTLNKFTAVGCDVLALMNTSTTEVFGCKSGCDGLNFRGDSICPIGSSCCRTTLPADLQDFKVKFDEGSGEECAYAFLANESWAASKRFSDLSSLARERGSVPVALEWGISNNTDLFCRLNYLGNCVAYSLVSYDRRMPFFQCPCPYGYDGNGYLVNGCADIDECEESLRLNTSLCPDNLKCVNRLRGYDCVDSWKRVKFVLIGTGSTLGSLLLLLCAWRLYKYIKKRKEIKLRKKYFERNGGLLLQQQMNSPEGSLEGSRMFTSKDLEVATDNFSQSRVLGHGGQGTVYKGMLADGRIVAIKKSMVVDEEKLEQFINEVAILSQINHRNVVKLLGCCLETQVPLLVYEFIPNGTLFEYLHNPNEGLPITWEIRLRIGTEISGALSYLHSAASIPIYHRDIKSTNILLDEKFRAKVADFGTSKSVSLEQTHVTTLVQGTFGYLDPEYFQTSQFTDKSDVYSFGVVLVELLTGQKPISSARAEEGRSLATYFIISMEENQLFDILHPQVKGQGTEEEISRVADLAKRCLHLHGKNRPTMKEVAAELEEIRNIKFPTAILQGKGNNCTAEEKNNCVALGRSDPDTISLSSLDDLPLLVTTSW